MENVSFDPGFSGCMLGVSDNVEFMYSAFVSSSGNLKQKKFQFSMLFPKIKEMLKTNVAFYLGCLLWAGCIQKKEATIEDNPYFDGEYNEEEVLSGVNYLIDFIENTLNKDSRYYINKTYTPDEKYIKILKTYKDFIQINKGFTKAKETKDILLPENLKELYGENLNVVLSKIDETLEFKNLNLLYDVYDLILD